jgi:hypothetical protein
MFKLTIGSVKKGAIDDYNPQLFFVMHKVFN